MKALASAEEDNKLVHDKSSSNNAHLSLASLDHVEGTDTKQAQTTIQQQAAANIFSAAQTSQSHFSKAIIGLLLIITACIAWFGFQLLSLNAHDAEVLLAQDKPYVNETAFESAPVKSVIAHQLAVEPIKPQASQLSTPAKTSIALKKTNAKLAMVIPAPTKTTAFKDTDTIIGETSKPIENSQVLNTPDVAVKPKLPSHRKGQTKPLAKASTIQVVRQQPQPSVDQTLLDAYNAYIKGQDATAKTLYRSVLKNDIRQIDALLGMAVIAQRQSRGADAVGWYKKVLEINPRNPTALSGIASAHPRTNTISQISHLKSLIASSPKTANYHAALGNAYASKNQWPLAQQAYFDANRYDGQNAEYAFNLAVSLEHLGKTGLATTHYQRALDLVTQSGASSPSRTQIEGRLNALQ